MMRSWAILVLALLPAVAPAAQPRVALVIGNSAYASGALPNPANDARLMAETLRRYHFQVAEHSDADLRTMKRAIQDFGRALERAGPGAVGLFYYAGHGVQLNGRNYLIPSGASIEREGDVDLEAVTADTVIEQMRYARNGLNILILDACRNNPFTRSMRAMEHGLATMDAPAGILIAYSTAPGSVAEDGTGRNSPYTQALSHAMAQHEPVEQVFKHVRVNVLNATGGKQVPWEASSLVGEDFFINERGSAGAALANLPPPPAPTPDVTPPANRSPSLWDSVTRWFNPESPQAAVAVQIPAAAGLSFLETLGIDAEPPAQHGYTRDAIRQLIATAPRRATLGSTPAQIQAALAMCRQYESDCELKWYEDETLRSATLAPFELDEAPVSVRAFRQFADANHYRTYAEKSGSALVLAANGRKLEYLAGANWRNGLKRHPVYDDAPVVGVDFADATAYCRANGARLPTEDEWEYVARGPARSVFPWGDDLGPARALNVAPRAIDGPPEGIGGRYKGLSGNVWQWVNSKQQNYLLLKGGSWLETNAANKRAAVRRTAPPDNADEDSGFRCARSVSLWPDSDFWMSQLAKSQGK